MQDLIKDIVQKQYNIRIDDNTRKAEYVEARAMYYRLMRKHCRYLSLDKIGKSVGRDHAGVINGINRLEGWLTYDLRVISKYAELNNEVIAEISKKKGVEIYNSLEELYESKYVELAKNHNDLLVKFEFIKNKLSKFHPHILDVEEFKTSGQVKERLLSIKTQDNKVEVDA